MRRTVTVGVAALVAVGLGGPAAVAGGPAGGPGPASPQRLHATNDATSITLNWSQPATGTRPAYFQVYEGASVVARNTTTHATVRNLVFGSDHTYTVTAVDRYGRESAPSAPISRTAMVGGPFACGMTAPGGLVATGVTASGLSLSWSNAQPYWDQAGTLVVLLDGTPVAETTLDNARISGLAPATTHTVQVARRDCTGTLHPSPALTVTTASGPTTRPGKPTGLAVTARTTTSVSLSWTPPAAGDPVSRYAVYDGATRVAVTTGTRFTVAGLWRDTAHQLTVSALDAAGGESAQSDPAAVATLPCDTAVPAPVALTATPRSASTVALAWVSTVEASGFVVYRSGTPVTTVEADSAVVTGLPSGSTAEYAVAAQTAACGTSAPSTPVTATTLSGPDARPAAPTGLAVTVTRVDTDNTATVTLAWNQPPGAHPVAGYRLYEGASVLATAATTEVTLTLPSGPSHTVSVAAVDPAGNESALDGPVRFSVAYLPPP